ncbi:Cytochrome c oxidase assembly factor 1-like [Oryzias melastigma]|uniref:Cytochrome c oxidase assembly factor 1-like n=1 Tax=Oryzias melastigma TaxID=30732 RepID=A0A834BUS6_ORYME|nr:Cytochrome c oxidase assembly factor 1-like [Oryzias melastigma]
MRVPIHHLQKLTIFTTILTGGGVGTMYYLMQKNFAGCEYHRLAVRQLEACPVAMESLGAPPLRVHNIHLTDRYNRVDHQAAQIKIPVTGSKTGGYLYTCSVREPHTNTWRLKQAELHLREGSVIDLLKTPPATHMQPEDATLEEDMDKWA